MSYPTELILKVIPQRYPFLMIDRIVSHEFRKKAVCRKNITLGEEVLNGHFPGKPIYPGVLMVEMGLQTTQIMLTDLEAVARANPDAEQGFLLQIEKFSFSKVAGPGDILEITAELSQEVMGMIKAKITLTNQNNEEVASGKVVVGRGH